MKFPSLIWIAVLGVLTACTSTPPYRNGDYLSLDSCDKVYKDYDNTLLLSETPAINGNDACWKQSREKHEKYDALFVEFDDQGWVQGSSEEKSPTKKDHLSNLYSAIRDLRGDQNTGQRLSILVFVHGWQHNAEPDDPNVHAFRRMLLSANHLETVAAGKGPKPRVVGIYVGWRGKSLRIPVLNNLTFWERKNTAEKVAQGGVRELFLWLDWLRDTDRPNNEQYVTVLTIGHSFGGLVTFEAMNSDFVRNGVRFKSNPLKPEDRFMSRVGDLVVIANPAFEGARYEELRAVARRFPEVERNQLPVVIVATSEADWATRYAFPIARWFNVIFESSPGEEAEANVKTVGHNSRYITHELSLCKGADCEAMCKKRESGFGPLDEFNAQQEYEYMAEIARRGFDFTKKKPAQQRLCDGLELKWTSEAYPDHNPYWVVRTTGDIMRDHNDIFNENMVAFVRQIFSAFVAARNQYNEGKRVGK
ncbi:MAG: hypothetical protein OEV08_10490 [Nitrospira sp.]|nr:hypothetical protein [Nitrospira sp.]